MSLLFTGALMLAAGIGTIFYVRSPEDAKLERTHAMSVQEVLLSNLVLGLLLAGGALVAASVF